MPIIEEQNLTEFLAEVKLKMENITFSNQKYIQEINNYVYENDGKFIRSRLVYLYGSHIGIRNEKLLELAAAVELIHLSTLVHDDIIDDAPIRRGRPTIYKNWGAKKALLYGDYLYTKTFSTLNSLKNKNIAGVLIECAEKLIEGEFQQISEVENQTNSLEKYKEIINAKTAVLFSGALKSIGIYAEFNAKQLDILFKLGHEFGYAFQLNDDLMDFNSEIVSGKKKYKDLDEGKLTFPLLISIESSMIVEKEEIYACMSAGNFQRIEKIIESHNGFEKTRIERDSSIKNCIEYTKNFIKLDNTNYIEFFLKDTLKA